MFTGIISDLGSVRRIVPGGDQRFEIATAYDTGGIEIGASIACSGACLTVIERDDGWFAVAVSAETLAKTTLGRWREGDAVNLERALKVGDELGGHLLSGHVDDVAALESRVPEGDSLRLRFRAPAALAGFIAAKGSVALDGVSLTVNEVEDQSDGSALFGVNIIAHTAHATTMGRRQPGDLVNLEIDQLARYLERLMVRARS